MISLSQQSSSGKGLSGLIGRECGVERHIQIFKRLGIWNEDGTTTPKAGDIITFNWDQNSQQNNGFADHIGIVESVSNGIIHTIEGNSNNQVRRNTYRIGHGNIRDLQLLAINNKREWEKRTLTS